MARMAPRFLAAISALLLYAAPAAAQTGADLEVAKQQFLLGKTYYEQAAYTKALKAFKESYQLSKRADLLYNIARCYESLAQLPEAITHYQRYLKDMGKTDAMIEARIRNLQARIDAQRKPPIKPPDKTPDKTPTTQPVKTPDKTPATQPVVPDKTPPPPSGGISWMTYGGWGLVGVGAIMVTVGIVYGVKAKNQNSLLEDAYALGSYDWAEMTSLDDNGKKYNVLMVVGLVTGILAAGGGAALLLLAPSGKERQTVSNIHFAPFITDRAAGLGGGFSF